MNVDYMYLIFLFTRYLSLSATIERKENEELFEDTYANTISESLRSWSCSKRLCLSIQNCIKRSSTIAKRNEFVELVHKTLANLEPEDEYMTTAKMIAC